METKTCSTCGEIKDAKYFEWRSDNQCYRKQCRKCHKGYDKYLADHQDEIKQLIDTGYKACGKCKQILPLCNFRKDRHTRHGYTSWCKQCKNSWNADNSDKIKITRIANVYKVDRDKAAELHAAAVCPICECDISMFKHIDHSHKTGEVRGALCKLCNMGLGTFRDSPDLLRRAAVYLEKYHLPL